jgi:hypothetical protein
MKYFDQFIQYRALSFKFSLSGGAGNSIDLVEHHLASGSLLLVGEDGKPKSGTIDDVIPMQNVCAKLTVELVQKMEEKISILEMSKRQFIELAVIHAIARIDEILDEVDVFENLQELSEQAEQGGN